MKLEDILAQPYILADGAMGTYLISKGYTSAQQLDMINITHPEIVAQIHGEYIDAGASLIETNTFSANCFKLAAHGHQDQVYLVNKMGGIIARRAAEKKGDKGKEIMVGGSIGPMGKMLAPIGKITEEEATESFRQQVHGLIAGGVDLLIIETFTDLQELGLAIKVVKEITDLPIAAHKTFIESGNKIIGELPAQVANFLREKGADIIGANCTVGPQRMLQIIGSIRQAVGEMPLSAFPNAGLPRRTREMITYTTTPEYMAEYAIKLVQAGVKIIGGCCGTTPKHIYAIKQALASLAEIRVISPEKIKAEIKEQEALGDERQKVDSQLSQTIKKQKVITVELDLPQGIDISSCLEGASYLKAHGFHGVNIPDGARARLRMSPIVTAHLVNKNVGIEPILHFTCRDRNLLGLQSELMGACALGIMNILAISGDPANIGDYPDATSVFDVDSLGLVKILSKMNEGYDLADNPIGKNINFFIGVAVNLTANDFEFELDRFFQKVELGAQFAISQPVYEPEILERFLTATKNINIPLLIGVLPLRSSRHAEFLHNEVPGISIPKWARERMAQARKKNRMAQEGINLAAELIKQVKDQVNGIYLMPPFKKYETAVKVIQQSIGDDLL